MNYVPPHQLQHPPRPAEPCRHRSYIANFTGLPAGMARCSNVRCGQVFLRIDRTQACEDAVYTTDELAAARLHDRCSGYVLSPDSRCQCPCHGTRLVAPARPLELTEPDPIDGSELRERRWVFEHGTLAWISGQPHPVLYLDGHAPITLSTVAEVDTLMAALAGARVQLAQGGAR